MRSSIIYQQCMVNTAKKHLSQVLLHVLLLLQGDINEDNKQQQEQRVHK